MEAVGSAGEQASLVVEAFDNAVGEPVADIRDDVVEMLADRFRGVDEGRQTRTAGPGEPLLELGLDDVWLTPIEDGGEVLLEEIGTIESCIVFLQSDMRSPWLGVRFQGFFSSGQRRPLILSASSLSTPMRRLHSSRRVLSRASLTKDWTWKRSKTIWACGSFARTALM